MTVLLRLAFVLQLAAAALLAHSMSMSNGDLRLDGNEAVLTVDLPAYEVQQLDDPEAAVIGAFAVRVEGSALTRLQAECAPDNDEARYVCTVRYELPEETAVLEVQCDLADAVVANHVHVLRAVSPGGAEQRVFDYASRTHRFRFETMGFLERWSSEAWAGAVRIFLGPAQVLFLLALVVAARGREELLTMGAAFLATLAVAAAVVSVIAWQPPPGFLDAAGALTIAYLAVETLTLPDAGGRWLVAGGMGAFHGLYFGVFLQQAPMLTMAVLLGVFLASILLLSLAYSVFTRLDRVFNAGVLRKISAVFLGFVGIGWFMSGLINM